MDRIKKFYGIVDQFMRVMNKLNILESEPRKYGTNYLLYKSEIHSLETIGDNPDANLTEIAEILGVTKGAISQITNKLERHGLIIKTNKPGNSKEVFMELTEDGKKAYKEHQEYHKNHFDGLFKEFDDVDDEQMLFIEELFKRIETVYDNFISIVEEKK